EDKGKGKAAGKIKGEGASQGHGEASDRQAGSAQVRAAQAMTDTDLSNLTIAEAGRLIAAKRLSPVELAKAKLARIEALDPRLNAFLLVTEKQALAEARAAERAVMAGRWYPLLGIPVGYKDIYETAGVRTTAHSRILADNVPRDDAETVRRLTAEGAVMLGKLATHECATGRPAFWPPSPPAPPSRDARRV